MAEEKGPLGIFPKGPIRKALLNRGREGIELQEVKKLPDDWNWAIGITRTEWEQYVREGFAGYVDLQLNKETKHARVGAGYALLTSRTHKLIPMTYPIRRALEDLGFKLP